MNADNNLRIRDAMYYAFRAYKQNFLILTGISFAALIFMVALLFIKMIYPTPGTQIVITLAQIILSSYVMLGYSQVCLKIFRNEKPKMDDFFYVGESFFQGIASNFLVTIYVIFWGLLLIIPGIICSVNCSLTFLVVVDNKLGAHKNIVRSSQLVKGVGWKIFFVLAILFVCLFLTAVTIIGPIIIVPYAHLCLTYFYINQLEKVNEQKLLE